MTITGVKSRTILGPLTTTFTPPSSCNTIFGDGLTGYRAQVCKPTNQLDNTACWPTTSSGAAVPTQPLQGWGFYSPGIICPAGHYSACSATAGSTSNWQIEYSMVSGETAVGCCPSGYYCTADLAHGVAQTCVQYNTLGTLSTYSCTNGTTSTGATVLDSDDILTAFAPMIQINWRAVDRGLTDTIATETGTSTSTSISATKTKGSSKATATTLAEAASTSSASTSGISTGAAIGIAVGVSLGVLLTAVFVGCLLWRRRRRAPGSSNGPQELDSSTAYGVGGAGMAAYGAGSKAQEMAMANNPNYVSQTPAPAYPVNSKEMDVYNNYRGIYEPPKELDSSPAMEPVEMMGSLPPYANSNVAAELPVETRSVI